MELGFEQLYSEDEYYRALRALLPKGPYWESLLEDEQSDLVRELRLLAGQVKAENDELSHFLGEAFPHKAVDLIAEWEALAELEAGSLSLEERQDRLRKWRAGDLNSFESFASLLRGFEMELLRIEMPYRPFRMGMDIGKPLCLGWHGNIVRFVIDPLGVKVRDWEGLWSLADDLGKPLAGPEFYKYVAYRQEGLELRLNEKLQAQQIAELWFV